jgi:Tfp pilus assembly pilus retraction ATPase PilT
MIQTGVSKGMHTMEQSLARFVAGGQLSPSETLNYAYDPKDLRQLLTQQNSF